MLILKIMFIILIIVNIKT